MNKICTSIEQSKKLIELGIDVNTADMLWTYDFVVNDINGLNIISDNFKPEENDVIAWSLSALLSVLPKNLNIGRPSLDSNYMGYYWIQYYDEFMKPNNYKTECFNNPIDACVEMIVFLKENKKL